VSSYLQAFEKNQRYLEKTKKKTWKFDGNKGDMGKRSTALGERSFDDWRRF